MKNQLCIDVTICASHKHAPPLGPAANIQINEITKQVWGLCECWVKRLFCNLTNTTCDNKIICHHSLFARASTEIKIRASFLKKKKMFIASADCCYLSGIRASLFCLDTRSPRHSCPPCPSQRQTCLRSPWHNLPKAQGRGENTKFRQKN